jgi:hypothetical protein
MAELAKVPRPSDLDDWDLYKRLVAEGGVARGGKEEENSQMCSQCGRVIGVKGALLRVKVTRKFKALAQALGWTEKRKYKNTGRAAGGRGKGARQSVK